nr:30S ribosomal protein S16 [Kocuria rosea]
MARCAIPVTASSSADSRKKRDGRVIEEIGKYHPTEHPSYIEVVSDRAQYWLGVGAQPSEAVAAILKVTGDWQRFKGEEGAEGTLRTREPKAEFVAPDKGSVIVPEAITPKGEKAEPAAPGAESDDAPAADAEKAE